MNQLEKYYQTSTGSNSPGITLSEILRAVTGGIITPELVTNISIATGKSEPVIKNLLETTAPSARAVLIKSLMPTKN